MITQIEIDGFKTFKDFKVELAPFQVIVGPNGSGKSNLFDAMHLLSRLADVDLAHVSDDMRGDPSELFTKLPDGKSVDNIRIAVEMLLDSIVRDQLGQETQLKHRRLRYEIDIAQGIDTYGLERLYVRHESLRAISQNTDEWDKKYRPSSQKNLQTNFSDDQVTFIETKLTPVHVVSLKDKPERTVEQDMIYLYLDNDKDGQTVINRFYTSEVERTVLSTIANAAYPHAFAVHEELLSLRILHLNPEALRQPSLTKGPRFLSHDGGNLPTTLVRMQAEDRFALNDVSLDLANLVPELTNIELKRDKVRNEYTIWAHFQDGRSFSSRVLSDGTLQLLALVTLKNDPQFHGVLCFEEPENGIHPTYLREIAHLLRGLTTDFNDPQQINEPLKQILVTTHSPTFISQPDVIDALLFTYTMTRVEPQSHGIPPIRVTHATPVLLQDTLSQSINGANESIDKEDASFTLDQVKSLLTGNSLNEALERLNQSHTIIEEN